MIYLELWTEGGGRIAPLEQKPKHYAAYFTDEERVRFELLLPPTSTCERKGIVDLRAVLNFLRFIARGGSRMLP